MKFNPDPGRLPLVETRKDVELKRIAFEQLNYHDQYKIKRKGNGIAMYETANEKEVNFLIGRYCWIIDNFSLFLLQEHERNHKYFFVVDNAGIFAER